MHPRPFLSAGGQTPLANGPVTNKGVPTVAFFKKVKNFFGIATVVVTIETPDTFSENQGTIDGTIVVTGKSEQEITLVKIGLFEHWRTGGGEDKTEKHFELGGVDICTEAFTIQEGEERKFPFSLPFSLIHSKNDEMAGQGGVMGAMGKVGAFLDQEKSTFKLVAMADVKAATFDPNCEKVLKKV